MCCTDMPAGALSAQVEAFQTVNPVCFLVVNSPVFPPQLNMNMRATVAYPGFCYFPDTQGYRPIIPPALPVVNGSALHQEFASPPDTDTVSLPQKMHRLTLQSRPQNFF
ncbi:Cellulose synthase regulatory subunit [Klebsiella quasipneumoniae subsp. similipneumoniae]